MNVTNRVTITYSSPVYYKLLCFFDSTSTKTCSSCSTSTLSMIRLSRFRLDSVVVVVVADVKGNGVQCPLL